MLAPYIQVEKIHEAGYIPALEGLRLSYLASLDKMPSRAETLAPRLHTGEAKFLEHLQVWLRVTAPRYWWVEADTYRHSSKQSESTMHTLKRLLKQISGSSHEIRMELIDQHFELFPGVYEAVENLTNLVDEKAPLYTIKAALPEGFLQTRVWTMSYKGLAHIIGQRTDHPLPHWTLFIASATAQVDHPELLPRKKYPIL